MPGPLKSCGNGNEKKKLRTSSIMPIIMRKRDNSNLKNTPTPKENSPKRKKNSVCQNIFHKLCSFSLFPFRRLET